MTGVQTCALPIYLKTIEPISGKEFTCENCNKVFRASSDRATIAKYRWFLDDLFFLRSNKRYSLYVVILCQSLEMFFYQAIINNEFDRNHNLRDEEGRINVEKYNQGIKEYDDCIEKLTFVPMREKFIEIYKEEINEYRPRGIELKKDRREECFDAIKKTNINQLRNNVIHKYAYRPSLADIKKYESLIDAIYWLGLYLDVKDSIFYINKKMSRDQLKHG